MTIGASLKKGLTRAFNLTLLEKDRLAWVDYLKGIALLLVVYRHVLIGIQRYVLAQHAAGHPVPDVPQYLETANMIFFSFRMPLFFILSGLFIGGSLKKRSLGQVVSTKFENLLYPYFIWVTLQITLQIVLGRYANANRSVIDYTYILYQPRNLDQFWYLPALFNTTVIYLLVKTKLKPPAWGQILIGLLLYFISAERHIHSISMLSDWMEFYLFFAIGDVMSASFFGERTQRFLKNPYSLLAITPIFLLTQVYYLRYPTEPGHADFLAIALIGCLSMFILSFRMQSWKALPFLRILGYHSLYVYVMHVFVAGLVRMMLTRLFHIYNPFLLLFMGILFSVIIPIAFYNLFILNGPLWWLFSFTKPGTKQKPVTVTAIPATPTPPVNDKPAPRPINRRKAIGRILIAGIGGGIFLSGYKWYSWTKSPDISWLEKQRELVTALAETIIPATPDSPGAAATGTGDFIITMVRDCTSRMTVNKFIDGLKELDHYSREHYSDAYEKIDTASQEVVLKLFEEEGKPFNNLVGKVQDRFLGKPFFSTLKEYTVMGYCTSEGGATKGLDYLYIPGHYQGCIPLKPGQKAWATK